MKFLLPVLASVSLVTGAVVDRAASQASIDTINSAVADITNRARALGVSVSNFTNIAQVAALVNATGELQSTLEAGVRRIEQSSGVRGVDALQLTEPILGLRATVVDTVQAVIDKAPVFNNLSVGSVVYTQLQDQQCASQQFTNATKSRLPAGGLHAVADNLAAPIFAALQRGLDTYAPTNSSSASTKNCTQVSSESIDGPENAAIGLAANHFGMVVAIGLAVVMVV